MFAIVLVVFFSRKIFLVQLWLHRLMFTNYYFWRSIGTLLKNLSVISGHIFTSIFMILYIEYIYKKLYIATLLDSTQMLANLFNSINKNKWKLLVILLLFIIIIIFFFFIGRHLKYWVNKNKDIDLCTTSI